MDAEIREKILDAAERLLAEQGYERASVRAITAEAGVNIAAVNYHFGSKEGLVWAALDRIIEPLNRRRSELLEAELSASSGAPLPVEIVLEAFLRPDVEIIAELRSRDPAVARFLGRLYGSRTPEIEAIAREQFLPVASRFRAELVRALPHLEEDEISWRLRNCVVGTVTAVFSATGPAGEPAAPTAGDAQQLLDRMLAALVPAMAAPTPEDFRRKAPIPAGDWEIEPGWALTPQREARTGRA
jgi:AcrR family transcriptional regulator